MTITYQEAVEILNALSAIAIKKGDTPINDKLTYAVTRNITRLKPIIEAYNEKVNDIATELCSVDKDGNIYDPKKFTPEKEKERMARVREVLQQVVEFEPYTPKDAKRLRTLDLEILTTLKGVLIDEDELEDLIED